MPTQDYSSQELLDLIVEAATEVYQDLKDGHNEKVYERALAREFRIRDIPYSTQVHVEVMYKGQFVGDSIIDLLVDDRIVVEAKATANISKNHCAQNMAYMRSACIEFGVVINFPTPLRDDVQCVVYELGRHSAACAVPSSS